MTWRSLHLRKNVRKTVCWRKREVLPVPHRLGLQTPVTLEGGKTARLLFSMQEMRDGK